MRQTNLSIYFQLRGIDKYDFALFHMELLASGFEILMMKRREAGSTAPLLDSLYSTLSTVHRTKCTTTTTTTTVPEKGTVRKVVTQYEHSTECGEVLF